MMENEIYNCDVIQDLLPLYHDKVCSETSRSIVEAHLKDCLSCQTAAAQLGNTQLDEQLLSEKNGVLTAHARKERKKTLIVGIVTACILTIPILVCFICNLAVGHALDWFFIVLASLLLVASLTVVPLVVPEKAGLWTILSAVSSLILLLLVTCIYSRGDWFFLAAVPTVFGLSVVLAPFVVYQLPLPDRLSHSKGLLVMCWDTFWLYAVIVVCGLYSTDPEYWRIALSVTTYCLLIPWSVFLFLRYTSLHILCKCGCIVWLLGLIGAFGDDIINFLALDRVHIRLLDADLIHWGKGLPLNNAIAVRNGNVSFLILFFSAVLGGVLFGLGLYLSKRQKN